MEAHGAGKVPRVYEAEGSEPSIEIKIKTLDSQTYTLRVDKQVPVPTLKEQIATVTGVLSDQQRLICCGKVLKDDQLLSAYHVEDGHTLHLVVRQPIPPPESLANHSGNEPASSASRGRMGPSVVIETFSMPDQGDGIPPEIGRIVSAVLGSFGFPNIGGGVEGIDATRDRGMQTEQASNRGGSDHSNSAFGLPTAVPFGHMHPHVMTNSLTTMSQYLSHMRCEFNASVTGGSRDGAASGATDSSSTRQSGSGHESMPTPASLAEVLQSSRQFLIEDVAQGLLQLGGQLESQATNTDSASRTNIQSNALRTGFQLYNLGALLLELGRTTMTVRLGQAPPEAVVNAGPAVFINSSGPNPLMVQPIPFQWGTSGGNVPVGLGQTGSSSGSVIGSGFLPRRIDIQIRRGPSTVTTNDNQSEHGDALQPEHGDTRQQQSGQRQATAGSSDANHGSQMSSRVSDGSTFAGDPSVRLVPVRTMVAALPATFGRLPFDSSGNSMGLYYPLLGGFQNSASGNANGTRTSQPSNEHPVDGQTEQQPLPELEPQLQNIEQRIRDVIGRLQDIASGPGGNDQGAHVSVEHRTTGAQTEQQSAPEAAALLTGSIPISNLRQQESSGTGSININVVSAGMNQNNHEPGERVPPNMFFDFLGNLFSEGEAQGENTSSEPAINGRGVPETSEPSAGHVDAAETSVTDEGLFLSNILHQVMPMITEHISAAPSNTTQGEAHTPIQSGSHDSSTQVENSEVGTSRRPDTDSDKPSSKRQKME